MLCGNKCTNIIGKNVKVESKQRLQNYSVKGSSTKPTAQRYMYITQPWNTMNIENIFNSIPLLHLFEFFQFVWIISLYTYLFSFGLKL